MIEFNDRHVVITGAGGGIGSVVAKRFAGAGGLVTILDKNEEAGEEVAQVIRNDGGKAAAFGCDITDRASIDAALGNARGAFGPVGVLVNNAAWDIFRPFLKTNPQEWESLISINLFGALHMHHAILPDMIELGGGRIVNIASDAARVGSSGEAVYSACKAGLVGFSKTIAREHARHGITVNVVCPGPTDTAMLASVTDGAADPEKLREAFRRSIPLGRLGQPEDLAGAILFLGSDAASFITGQVLSVSGGLTMVG